MRRVAAFVLTAALYLQSVVPAFASSGGADALVCRGNASRLSSMDYHNGTYALYTYDERSRVVKIEHKNSSHSVIAKEENTYDPASNITQRISGGVTTDYDYDEINQLIDKDDGTYHASYTYDANGNRLTRTIVISADGTRKVRFDTNRRHPHENPHARIEVLSEGKWQKYRIYPSDVPHR